MQELKSSGIIANEIGLYGRFHSQKYSEDIQRFSDFCSHYDVLCLPDASTLVYPLRSNSSGRLITSGPLHDHALHTILLDYSNWYPTFKTVYEEKLKNRDVAIAAFGPERCVPPSLARELEVEGSQSFMHHSRSNAGPEARKDDDIAVVGMSIKVAGADDTADFWDLLCNAESQHREITPERVNFDKPWRELEPGRKWFANMIDNPDAFDHKFFKKSAREAATTDPQQRILLQVAYRALEQAGYFNTPDPDRNVGCYIGVCAADYEQNVACHQPNAFTATGNLKSFIAGKVSHYFGWTGTGLCIDTACSSSLVAVHLACKAILSGEINSALAGGVNVITSPLWFQNLAAASFLSPTGQCKPFDAGADGYCRGEGFGAVYLKRMSTALADGDQILGSISGSAVYQNQNCTPIFVPNSPSLSDLFRNVLNQSKLEPSQVSFVEAHGTGTQVGDPAEYDSIRQVLGGPVRSNPLLFGSVKGLVGHTECTSGVVSLIKTILMVQQKAIPKQSSFSTLNPHIKAAQNDKMEITTSHRKWNDSLRAALINNYGASGSNASMLVTQSPNQRTGKAMPTMDHPIRLCGKDDRALQAYAGKLYAHLSKSTDEAELSLANLSFGICRQSNPALDRAWFISVGSKDQLLSKLAGMSQGKTEAGTAVKPADPPVILTFGGQASTYVGLNKEIFDYVTILRHYLERCDAVCRSIGIDSIFPAIFERNTISDVVKLQTCMFAAQYACAMSWIDCGLKPVAVVGHSFGELTALCVAGVLSLTDALKMISGRAKIIQESWGAEKGSMLAADADIKDVEMLLEEAASLCKDIGHRRPEIACVNGPRSVTIAGSVQAIDLTIEIISKNSRFSGVRSKKLNVTNAFHSTLVEPLMADLEKIGEQLTFNEPTIPIERATEFQSTGRIQPGYVAEHMRRPVYFNQAVQRLAKQYPSAVWLDTGCNASVNLVSRALNSPKSCHFQPFSVTNENGIQQLTAATAGLWQKGLIATTFWAHHRLQTYEYAPVILPSYQFEKSQHWTDFKDPPVAANTTTVEPVIEEPKGLWSFSKYLNDDKTSARFRINTMTEEYRDFVSGHMIAQTAPICPATLEVDIAIEAIITLLTDFEPSKMQPKIHKVENQSPICNNPARTVWLDVECKDGSRRSWKWKIISESSSKTSTTTHVTGTVKMEPVADIDWQNEFSRYERLVSHHRCSDLLSCDDADDIIQGRHIYKAFSEVVDYSEKYRGVQKIVGKGTESAGRIIKKRSDKTWLDTTLSDCFSQIGGVWVNCMTDTDPGDMYIATGFDKWMRSPFSGFAAASSETWDVFANHHRASDEVYMTDIFIFNPSNGKLLEVILGIHYHKVAKASMRKILSRLAGVEVQSIAANPTAPQSARIDAGISSQVAAEPAGQAHSKPKSSGVSSAAQEVKTKTKALLAEISGLEPEAIQPDAQLADIGIDSLMGMELARDLETLFKCSLPMDELAAVVDFTGLIQLLQSTLGLTSEGDGLDSSVDSSDSEESRKNVSTPGSITDDSDVEQPRLSIEEKSTSKPELSLPSSMILESFEKSKRQTDHFISEYRCAGYMDGVLPRQTQLCVALTVEAFEQLGCSLKRAAPDEQLQRIEAEPSQKRLLNYLYSLLEEEARLIDTANGVITRTAIATPAKSSQDILSKLLRDFPDHEWANRLTFFASSRLADVLTGKCDGIKLIFGTEEGKQLVTGLYGDSLLNKLANVQMQDIIKNLALSMPKDQGPLKILELGAGTGGTTRDMVALLAEMNVPTEYTFTDLSGSFVAQARKSFKEYPFMKFRVHDIEKAPAADLLGTQHIVIASNAIHATHNLQESVRNVRKALRPDGFLMMLEMTKPVYWVDLIFGLFEGWWLFDDDRQHAIAHETVWERQLHSAGYGHVDWTDGHSPEVEIQRVIVATASGPQYNRESPLPLPTAKKATVDPVARQVTIDKYVETYSRNFAIEPIADAHAKVLKAPERSIVLLTGATGSLGAHLVAHLASLSNVASVVCVNRRSRTTEAKARQQKALEERGIQLDEVSRSKVHVLQTDTTQPLLGLSSSEYTQLSTDITHIIHNAWPMSGVRSLPAMEPQFKVMRNLIDLARDISLNRPSEFRVSFGLVSSIAVVGHHPLAESNIVPEERMRIGDVLPNGYGEAKFICERLLDETLHLHIDRFRTLTIRPGQIAGSRKTGYWNTVEHLPFLIKSSQTLRSIPAFEGDLCWTPVEDVAGTVADLVLAENTPYPVYHIDNPIRQEWRDMIPVIAKALDIPSKGIVPFKEWVKRVRSFPGSTERDNPAAMLVDFLDDNFLRMSCGGLLLGTAKSCEHSRTLAAVGAVRESVVHGYIDEWKRCGFLY